MFEETAINNPGSPVHQFSKTEKAYRITRRQRHVNTRWCNIAKRQRGRTSRAGEPQADQIMHLCRT